MGSLLLTVRRTGVTCPPEFRFLRLNSAQNMSAMACGVLTISGVLKDENGLILPRKISNPCIQSSAVRHVHSEIRWNSNKGVNVLNNKSELEKVLAKQRRASEQREEAGQEVEDEFHKIITERAKRLEQLSKEEFPEEGALTKPNLTKCQPEKKSSVIGDGGTSVIQQESEFEKVFAQLRREKRELVC